jgi:glycosyltransferase involved in cell wall biosynthesis
MPMISIITVCLNSRSGIVKTVDSVLNQNFIDYEYIVIDGASTDGTIDVIKAYASKFQQRNICFRWISEPDCGISDAFNKGIAIARGEYVHLLNADDSYYSSNILSEIVAAIYCHKCPEVIYGRSLLITDDGTFEQIYGEPFDGKLKWRRMLLAHPSTLVKRSFYETVGYFNLHYKLAMDYDWVLRAAKFTDPIYIDNIWTLMALGGASDLKVFSSHRECFIIIQKNNGGKLRAFSNFSYRYLKTAIRLLFYKIGIRAAVRFYRRTQSRY